MKIHYSWRSPNQSVDILNDISFSEGQHHCIRNKIANSNSFFKKLAVMQIWQILLSYQCLRQMNHMSASLKHFIPASFHLCGESCPLSHSACIFWNCTLAPPSGSPNGPKLNVDKTWSWTLHTVHAWGCICVRPRNSTEYPITHLNKVTQFWSSCWKENNYHCHVRILASKVFRSTF